VGRKSGGAALGEQCSPGAGDPCAGRCLEIGDGVAACSAVCTRGTKKGCGWDGAAKTAPEGACALSFTADADDVGDYGACAALCDCDEECAHADFGCLALPKPDRDVLGRRGFCSLARGKKTLTSCSVARTSPSDAGGAESDDAGTFAGSCGRGTRKRNGVCVPDEPVKTVGCAISRAPERSSVGSLFFLTGLTAALRSSARRRRRA
jgi:hypothetical protein